MVRSAGHRQVVPRTVLAVLISLVSGSTRRAFREPEPYLQLGSEPIGMGMVQTGDMRGNCEEVLTVRPSAVYAVRALESDILEHR